MKCEEQLNLATLEHMKRQTCEEPHVKHALHAGWVCLGEEKNKRYITYRVVSYV